MQALGVGTVTHTCRPGMQTPRGCGASSSTAAFLQSGTQSHSPQHGYRKPVPSFYLFSRFICRNYFFMGFHNVSKENSPVKYVLQR